NLRDGEACVAVAAPLDGDDARQLLDAVEAFPLPALRVEVGPQDQRPAVLRMLPVEPFQQVDGPRLAGLALGAGDPGARQLRSEGLTERDPVLVRAHQPLVEGMLIDG